MLDRIEYDTIPYNINHVSISKKKKKREEREKEETSLTTRSGINSNCGKIIRRNSFGKERWKVSQ